MGLSFDFGFEQPGATWEEAQLAFLFATEGTVADFGKAKGPLAVADASRYIELFEMQIGVSPLDRGTYAEIVGGPDLAHNVMERLRRAKARQLFSIVIAKNRGAISRSSERPLVALWGKVGRPEVDETSILVNRQTVLAGVRAATSAAFQTIPSSVTIVTARGLKTDSGAFEDALTQLNGPVHLSIDLDVLAPGVAQTQRSLEPGGLSWYELMSAMELVFKNPGVASAELVGTATVEPRSPSALAAAQVLLRLAGLVIDGNDS